MHTFKHGLQQLRKQGLSVCMETCEHSCMCVHVCVCRLNSSEELARNENTTRVSGFRVRVACMHDCVRFECVWKCLERFVWEVNGPDGDDDDGRKAHVTCERVE